MEVHPAAGDRIRDRSIRWTACVEHSTRCEHSLTQSITANRTFRGAIGTAFAGRLAPVYGKSLDPVLQVLWLSAQIRNGICDSRNS